MNLLETTKLVKTYDGRTVVDEVSFVLAQEEIVGLLGRNGAGKTTTFRMILGMVTPDSGAVAFDGVRRHPPADVQAGPPGDRLSVAGAQRLPPADACGRTSWPSSRRSISPRSERNRRADELLSHYGLTRQRNQRAETLSGGERRKLEIARALVTEPKLILLDEPFSGVDPIAVEDLQREVIRLKRGVRQERADHRSQRRPDAQGLRPGPDHQRRPGLQGRHAREIINDPAVRSAYLGNTFRGDEFD